ncbi:phosphoglucosamine mutase [Mycoplasmatota bacterium WC30]
MKYFGTDGIRGLAYDFIDYEMAYSVGRSMSLLEKRKVVVCRDTRESGHMIIKAIKKGIIDAGLQVLDIDILATPILAFMTIQEDCYGIMVTASHNPYIDNGIKVFNRGKKTTHEEEKLIEAVIDGITVLENIPGGVELPYLNPLANYFSLYKDFLTKSSLKIALDLANGASIKSAKFVFTQITDKLEYIGDEPNGLNINENVGSTHINNLATYVTDNKFDIGFSFDGDGDRVLVVDENGKIIDGDLLVYIFACYLKENNLLNNDLVVLTKMSNIGIIEALNKKGIEVIQTDVGDKYVLQALRERNATIGGENSGHIINRHLFISGDGVLSAAYLIKILEEKKTNISSLIEDVVFYPDKLVNLRDIDKSLVSDKRIIALVRKIEKALNGFGKVLVRASGTEPLVRISASAKTIEEVNDIIDTIAKKFKEIGKEKE